MYAVILLREAVTGRVAYKQMMPKDEERSIKEGEGRERNLVNQGVTAIYI